MEEQELIYWLTWNQVPGVGAVRFNKLLEEFGTMEQAWQAKPEQLQPIIGARALAQRSQVKVVNGERELKQARVRGIRIYTVQAPDYPAQLRKISDPPPVLFCRGDLHHGDEVSVAIVGTRQPTPMGAYLGKQLAQDLAGQGLVIISGMARGIDAEAHWGALEAGGRTIAVLGCGVNLCYPKENAELMEKIIAQGAVVSEFPLGTPPLASNFPARNRIISGLSLGVLVVEATDDSGSLITAGFALEQGREVFAVPGSIGSEGSKGPHKLIRQGAKLVETARDVLEELAIPVLDQVEMKGNATELVNQEEIGVYQCLTREPVHIDQITRLTRFGSAQVNAALVQLELKGVVKSFPGQLYMKLK